MESRLAGRQIYEIEKSRVFIIMIIIIIIQRNAIWVLFNYIAFASVEMANHFFLHCLQLKFMFFSFFSLHWPVNIQNKQDTALLTVSICLPRLRKDDVNKSVMFTLMQMRCKNKVPHVWSISFIYIYRYDFKCCWKSLYIYVIVMGMSQKSLWIHVSMDTVNPLGQQVYNPSRGTFMTGIVGGASQHVYIL